MPLILIIEDDPHIRQLIEFHLSGAKFDLICAENASEGIKLARGRKPELVILDLMLPDMSGLEVLKTIRGDPRTADIKFLILSAKSEEADKVSGLELGAEDYVTKPFSPKELLVRVRKILDRAGAKKTHGDIEFKELSVSPSNMTANLAGKSLDLTATEFDLLLFLLMNRGRLCSREVILNKVWGYSSDIYARTVDSHISRLREKLGGYGKFIQNVRGVGYRWEEK